MEEQYKSYNLAISPVILAPDRDISQINYRHCLQKS